LLDESGTTRSLMHDLSVQYTNHYSAVTQRYVYTRHRKHEIKDFEEKFPILCMSHSMITST